MNRLFRLVGLIVASWVIIYPTCALSQNTTQVFRFEIKDNQLVNVEKPPLRLRVKHRDKVEWQITSNQAGELHLHAYGIEVKVPKGKTVKYQFVAKASGKFQIEWHPEMNANQPNMSSHHSPLAYFEVYPE